ncbi:hypothetical protein HH303_13175 [Rhodospirillaceae bacterium KN72]|uniref:Class I SAM-dependent methyltransferase n=1 Tax=Pacificispira spongiicola TaxID=2729598 RepID=A0A7Y0E1C4_9PROT|nr:hypothetical protein [Pacificispira spongiicola]NMM45439.1 hypothetical protein [Pacificispira spongiicola]
MILEALEYLMTPCPKWARDFGYLSESIAIRHRAKRCADAWKPHQDQTKAAILENCPDDAETIVVLGAGHCFDIPVPELARRCRNLVLVDAVRPMGLCLPRNTEFLTRDIHGLSLCLFEGRNRHQRGEPLQEFSGADYVVSANLISQLPILPLRHLARLGLAADLPPQDGLAAQIQRDHIADLKALSGRAVLIGDARRVVRDRSDKVLSDEALTKLMLLPTPMRSWSWHLVPPGENSDGRTVEIDVGVWMFRPDVANGRKRDLSTLDPLLGAS